MSDKIYDLMAKRKILSQDYRKIIESRDCRLRETLTKDQFDFLFVYGRDNTDIHIDFVKTMKNSDIKPSSYISEKMSWLFDFAISERNRKILLYYADKIKNYPYAVSCSRRSFRSNSTSDYILKIEQVISDLASQELADLPLDTILNRSMPEDIQAYYDENQWSRGYCSWQVAYALDMGDPAAEEAIYSIVTEKNGTGALGLEIIKGILYSGRKDFYELLGKLLLTAGLQEGLRQAICENADCGSVEGFLTLLKVIDNNNLIRFSSVKRAVGTWLGILSDEITDIERISNKSVRLIIDCLGDKSKREEYFSSSDAMSIYAALWSYGFDDALTSIEKIHDIVDCGSHEQLLVAGYFVENLDSVALTADIAQYVISRHNEEDILAVWLPGCLPSKKYIWWQYKEKGKKPGLDVWFSSREKFENFYNLMTVLYSSFSCKVKKYSPCIFPWYEAKISKSDIADNICFLSMLCGENEKIDYACGLLKQCEPYTRSGYFSSMLKNPQTPIQRDTVIDGLADKGSYTVKAAFEIVNVLNLTDEEYRRIETFLKYKNDDIRRNVISLLMRQSDKKLSLCVSRLLSDIKEEVRLGGLDILMLLKDDRNRAHITKEFSDILTRMRQSETVTSKEEILIDSLIVQENQKSNVKQFYSDADKYLTYEFDNEYIKRCCDIYSEYFPDSYISDMLTNGKKIESFFSKVMSVFTKKSPCASAVDAEKDLISLSQFIDLHKMDEFKNFNGEFQIVGETWWNYNKDNDFPLGELWDSWFKDNSMTNSRLLRAETLFFASDISSQFMNVCEKYVSVLFGTGFERVRQFPYNTQMRNVLEYLCKKLPRDDCRHMAVVLAVWFVRFVSDCEVLVHLPNPTMKLPHRMEMVHILTYPQINLVCKWLKCNRDDEFKYIFPIAVALSERCAESYKAIPDEENYEKYGIYYHDKKKDIRRLHAPYGMLYNSTENFIVGTKEYLYAAYINLISKKELYEFIFRPEVIGDAAEIISAAAALYYEKDRPVVSRKPYWYYGYMNSRKLKDFLGDDFLCESDKPFIKFVSDVYDDFITEIVSEELKRGDTPAMYSSAVGKIKRVYGAAYFVNILSSIGNDTLNRNAVYGYGNGESRRENLSYLLSVCIPNEGDSADMLKEELKGKKISDKRLIEAALYSPEWISIIGEYLKIDSFESVCYYFIAHMNERFDDKRRAIIARFTPLSEEELNFGAFDINWFLSAYGMVGEKEFERIYDAAKYITDGSKHTRARKYADAALGKLDINETEQTIRDKRNKDLLMAYSLIPIENDDDVCRRYLFIQRFLKESKKFGAQRSASEGKAAEMSLKNLASNAGYSDSMRLTLRMESKIIADNRELFDEHVIDNISIKINIDDCGHAELICKKDGKQLKNIPSKFKNHETVLSLSNMKNMLCEQYRRTRIMLEQAMEDGVEFTFEELCFMLSHPVVYPMIKNLVFVNETVIGFMTENGIADVDGNIHIISPEDKLRIAHPYDLFIGGVWKNFQRVIFEKKTVQPFRQVFRELYIKTPDEVNTYRSLRYSGEQVQPMKTLAVLKGRRWVADIESGLQKIFYKENIVAEIYALADWFSPADIEAPTLEWVGFINRKTGDDIKISDIPDIIFSEVMRDVDLAVSVAHAGGVDPETSHSTIDMRACILSFVLPMFNIQNVHISDHHAFVDGKLARYSIHLGSGVVHQIGGTMIPVLPVHSQHRGRIFLPFVDDDPKTAEIISKVILFAEDEKIKDPMILSSISM